MRFLRFILTILFACGMMVSAIAQTDSLQYKVLSGSSTAINDSVPSKLFVASIAIYGNKKTKDFILQREIPFKQGDTISPANLIKEMVMAREQLINTRLFLDADVYVENRYGQFVFITVYVKERWYIWPIPFVKYIDPNFNTWWVTYNHSLKRLNYGLKAQHMNLTGRNDKLTLWLITGYSKQVAVKYERPFFDKKLKNGFSFLVNYSNQRELNFGTDSSKQEFFRPDSLFYLRKSLRAEAGYIYRPGLHVRHIFTAGYGYESISDTVKALNKNYFLDGKTKESFPYFSYTFEYNNADYNAYPTEGILSSATFLHRGFSKTMNLTQLQLVSTYTKPIFPKTQIQLKEGAMLNLPFKQPFYNKMMFGYGNGGIFMRGYEYYVMDGDYGAVLRATLQREIFNTSRTIKTSATKQLDIPFRFFAKIYGDAGYVGNGDAGNSILNNRLLYSWGLGLDIVTTYDLILKIDYSFNQLGDKGLFFHIRTDF